MKLSNKELLQVIKDKERIRKIFLDHLKESCDKLALSSPSSLEVNGVPEMKGERLKNIIARLSRMVSAEIEEYDILSIRRIGKSHPRPIVVKVKDKIMRDRLVGAVTEHNTHPDKHIDTSYLGFRRVPVPVLASEHPSPLNRKHRAQAKAARENILHTIPSKNKSRNLSKTKATTSSKKKPSNDAKFISLMQAHVSTTIVSKPVKPEEIKLNPENISEKREEEKSTKRAKEKSSKSRKDKSKKRPKDKSAKRRKGKSAKDQKTNTESQ